MMRGPASATAASEWSRLPKNVRMVPVISRGIEGAGPGRAVIGLARFALRTYTQHPRHPRHRQRLNTLGARPRSLSRSGS